MKQDFNSKGPYFMSFTAKVLKNHMLKGFFEK